jgi:hypothetical protein
MKWTLFVKTNKITSKARKMEQKRAMPRIRGNPAQKVVKEALIPAVELINKSPARALASLTLLKSTQRVQDVLNPQGRVAFPPSHGQSVQHL